MKETKAKGLDVPSFYLFTERTLICWITA